MRKDSGARPFVLLELARAVRTGKPAPTQQQLADHLGVTRATIATAVMKLCRAGKLRVVERRWPDFMRYEVPGIGTTGARVLCPKPRSSSYPFKPKPAPPTG